jgi:hypothetical protein
VVVHALHVVTQVPFPWKPIVGFSPLTGREFTKERVVSMVVQAMSLPLVSEQASVGREAKVLAVLLGVGVPACIRPEMGVQVFAVGVCG